MAGGVGTGLLVIGKCFCCDFDSAEEIDFRVRPTEDDIREAKEVLLESHKATGCKGRIVTALFQSTPYRFRFTPPYQYGFVKI